MISIHAESNFNFEYLLVNILKLETWNRALKIARELDDITSNITLLSRYLKTNDEEKHTEFENAQAFLQEKNTWTGEEKHKKIRSYMLIFDSSYRSR